MKLTYGSVCSGIEAASTAWEPLGWSPEWFAEIEPFPSSVLAHHWPHVPNLGDMTLIHEWVSHSYVNAPDVLVGGTPCQAFSVAGARKGLSDDRGFLTIKFVELANAIDQQRISNNNEPAIVVWENVPGVLSSKDNAFGAFLGFLAGEDCELVPPGKKWENAGCVLGPQRAIAWRILDAQYFGVAQRRRRVFVVASAREGFDPCQVLFEFEGVRRDPAPRREAGKAVTALTANGVGTSGADENQGQAWHLIPLATSTGHISHCLNAGGMGRIDYETETMVVHGTQDPDTSVEMARTLGCNQGQENAVLTQFGTDLTARHDSSPCADCGMNVLGYIDSGNGGLLPHEPMGTLVADSPSGGGRPLPAVAFSSKCCGGDATEDMSPTLRACGHANSHANAGEPPAVATATAVRRLTPIECERLQGMPDGHTLIPVAKLNKLIEDELAYLRRHRPDLSEEEAHRMAADGPRYKAIGNSMAVPCMRWIGEHIQQHLTRSSRV